MAPLINASTPARTGPTVATSITSTAFNPPGNSVVFVGGTVDTSGVTNTTITFSNSGTALNWVTVNRRGGDESGFPGTVIQACAIIPPGGLTGLTVTMTSSITGRNLTMRAYVLTGVNLTTVVGTILEGSFPSGSNVIDTTNLVTQQPNSLVLAVINESEVGGGNPTSTNTTISAYSVGGSCSGYSGYRTAGAAGSSVSFNADAAGISTAVTWNYVVAEINELVVVQQGAVSMIATATITTDPTVVPVKQGAVALSVVSEFTARTGFSGNVSLLASAVLSTQGRIVLLQVSVSMQSASTLTVASPRQTMVAFVHMNATFTLLLEGRRSRASSIVTRYERPAAQHPFRLIAQEILTGEFVDWDLPVQEDFEYTRQLSGPAIMTGSFKPEIISVQELGLDGYAYWFHVEINEEIRASGIFLPPLYEEQGLTFTCEGHASVPHFTTWESSLSAIDIDVFTIIRNLWNHVQATPRSAYGVIVSNHLAGRTLGTPAKTEVIPAIPPETVDRVNEIEAEPYELQWWEAPNCGEQIDTLAQQTPFDYRERVAWNSTKTDVLKYIDLGYPRLGTTRSNLEFNDENILEIVPVQENEDSYASEVIVIGAGEGSTTVRGYASENFDKRIKKSYVLTDKTITTKARANDVAKSELGAKRGRLFEISEIVVRPYHRNAQLGEYDIGDDIYIVVDIPWLNLPYGAWYRITNIGVKPSREIVRIAVELTSSFSVPR